MKFERQQRLGDIGNVTSGAAAGIRAGSQGYGSAAQAKMDVADTLQNFGKWGMERYAEMRVDSAEEEAREVDPSTGAPVLRDESTLTGKAYNEIVLAGHSAAVKNDYTRWILENVKTFEEDPEGFRKAGEEYIAETLNQVSPELRPFVQTDFEAAMIRPTTMLAQAEIERNEVDAVNQVLEASNTVMDDLAKAAREGNQVVVEHNLKLLDGMATSLTAMGYDSKAKEVLQSGQDRAQTQIELGRAQRAIEAGSGDAYIRNFMQNPPDYLTPEEVDTLSKTMLAVKGRYDRTAVEIQAGLTKEQERFISNLEVAINTDNVADVESTVLQIEELFNNSMITPAKRTELLTKLEKNTQQGIESAQGQINVGLKLTGQYDGHIDAKDMDAYYEQTYIPYLQSEGLSDEDILSQNAYFVNQMKYVPKALRDKLSNDISSNDPALMVQAVEMADMINEIPGVLDPVFNTHEQAMVDTAISLLPNMEPAEAIAQARKMTDPFDKPRIEARTEAVNEMEKGGIAGFGQIDYRAEVNDAFDSFWDFTDNVDEVSGDAVVKEYRDIFRSHYIAGSSVEASKKHAEQTIKRNWGLFNGRVMKYPPGEYYGVNGDTDYIMDQLYEDVNRDFYTDEPIKKENIFLTTTEASGRGGLPRYRVIVMDNDGHFQVMGDGEYYWYPDKQREIEAVQERNRQAMLEERERQEAINNSLMDAP